MRKRLGGTALIAALLLQACSAAGGAASVPRSAGGTVAITAGKVTAAADISGSALTNLPLDDYRYTTSGAKTSWIYLCPNSIQPGGPGEGGATPPWIDTAANTWSMLAKVAVEGAVSWTSQLSARILGSKRVVTGNGLPSHDTGIFPISSSDPAYQYDENPSAIASQNIAYSIPSKPAPAARPSCTNMGPIGIMLTGAVLFNALDAQGRDAAAHEVLDKCWGHPQQQGQYHYHTFSSCMKDTSSGHSALLGYALDGFGIYGPRGQNGTTLKTADLDECHGHTHAIVWNGKTVTMYHYHMTNDYPYSLSCYRGTPVKTSTAP
jgi:YHYH protein